MAVWESSQVSSLVTRGIGTLYSGDRNGLVKVWDLRVKNYIFQIKSHEDVVTGLDFEGNTLISCSGDGCVKFWDLRNNLEVGRYRSGGGLASVRAWGSRVVTGGNEVRVWEDGECFTLTKYWCKDILLSENCIIAACDTGIMVWDIKKIRR